MIAPTTAAKAVTVDQRLPVSVEYEWGRLEETIFGHGHDIVVAQWDEAYHPTFGPTINDWFRVHGGQRLDSFDPGLAAKTIEQQDHVAKLLIDLGVRVHRVAPLGDSTDRTFLTELGEGTFAFPRDPIAVIGSEIIETSPQRRWRRRERHAIRPILDRVLNETDCAWVSVPPPSTDRDADNGPYLEGGDILVVGDHLLVGRSGYATDERGIRWLRRHFAGRRTVIDVPLTTDAYHLDCALSLPRPGLAIAYPDAFVEGLPDLIRDWDVIEVTAGEQEALATNALILDSTRMICDERHSRVSDELRKRGIEVIEVPFDGPAFFGGGPRCSHHPLRRAGQ
jgi:glycine amidinotransferase